MIVGVCVPAICPGSPPMVPPMSWTIVIPVTPIMVLVTVSIVCLVCFIFFVLLLRTIPYHLVVVCLTRLAGL